jgi:protocatechuate 3,4-dioxygenase beta subunit
MRLHQQLAAVVLSLLALPAFAAVTGTVINLDGQAVAGAKVSLFTPETSDARQLRLISKSAERVPVASGTSDSKGNFSLDAGTNAIVDVRVEARGCAPDGTRAEAGEDVGVLALQSAEAKKGSVTAGGKPVAGAVVVWTGGGVELVTTTGADGSYSVPDPNVWATRVFVLHPDFAAIEDSIIRSSKFSLAKTLTGGTKLTGRVVAADGKTGVKASLRIDDWPAGETADDGTFTIAHAPAKWAKLEASTNDRFGMRTRGKDATVTVKLGTAAVVSGSVRDAKGQKPLPGSSVLLAVDRMFGAANARSVLTDAKGNFSLSGVAPGTYSLTLNRPGYGMNPVIVTVEPGQKAQKTLYAAQRGRITGTVSDEDKRGVGGARISTPVANREAGFMPRINIGQVAQRYSAPDGHYVLRNIEPDSEMKVEALKKGYPAASSGAVRVASGETKNGVNLTIPRGLQLTGRIVDSSGKAISGVAVSSTAREGGGGGMGGMFRRQINLGGRNRPDDSVKSGSDGTFSVRLKEGLYDLSFVREGYAAKNVGAVKVTADAKPLEVTLDPGVTLTGRVTRAGRGIEGANILVMAEWGNPSTTTGADGSFRIDDLTPGQAMLNVNKNDEFVQSIRPVTLPAKDLVIDLPAGGRISGRVVDKSGHQPVTSFDAGIQAARGGGGMMIMMPPQTQSFTTDDGSFVLENVPPGATTVVVNAAGFASGRVAGLNVEDGKSINDVEVSLEPAARLSGRVTAPDGAPAPGVMVRQEQGGGGAARMMRMAAGGDGSASTDANGDYTLEGLESGERTISFVKSGYPAEQRTVTLSGKDNHLDVRLSAGSSVGGTVVSESGGPVADASVRAMSAADGAFGRNTTTDSNGAFHFEGLAPGHYNFAASKAGYADGQVKDIDITATGPISISLKTGGVIYGTVRGLPPADMGHITVMASSPKGNASAPVDASGSFRIEGAPVGTVRVSAQKRDGLNESAQSPMKSIQVEAGTPTQVDLEFDVSIVVTGRVTRNGVPLANAPMSFLPNTREASVIRTNTDNDGSYRAVGLEQATYTVQVIDLTRMGPYSTSYDVKGSGRFDIDMKTVTLRGRVTDSDTGAPIAEAHVELRPDGSDSGGMIGGRNASTDPSGNFLFDAIVAGSYQVTAGKDDYGSKSTPLSVGSTSPSDMDIKLHKEGGITLKVIDARDRRSLNASVRVFDSKNVVVYEDFFRFDPTVGDLHLGVTAGSYRAVVSAMGYATQTVTITAPSTFTVALTPGGTLVLRSKSSSPVSGKLLINGVEYARSGYGRGSGFTIDPKPGVTTLQNIVPGTYSLQVLDGGRVINTVPVTIVEGQETTLDL